MRIKRRLATFYEIREPTKHDLINCFAGDTWMDLLNTKIYICVKKNRNKKWETYKKRSGSSFE